MKTCTKCKVEKDLTEFYTNGSYIKKDGSKTQKYKPTCKACENSIRVGRKLLWVREALEKLGKEIECERCGYNKSFAALEFHHLDPKEKDFTIGKVSTMAEARLKSEIAKCEILCANCHALEHTKYKELYKI